MKLSRTFITLILFSLAWGRCRPKPQLPLHNLRVAAPSFSNSTIGMWPS